MFKMCYKIKIGNYSLRILDSVKITKSIENLIDTAVIVLPGAYLNTVLRFDEIKEGDRVEIQLGYGEEGLRTEFTGYLNNIAADDGSIKLECEDGIYLFKKPLKDRELKEIKLETLLMTVVDEINKSNGTSYSYKCNYDFTWEKFVFFKTTGFDVLKKIQEEISANIYFEENELHIHPPYSKIANNTTPVIFDFTVNIEKSDLKYVKKKDKNVEVEVVVTKSDGTVVKKTYGKQGGTKVKKIISSTDENQMKDAAKNEYDLWVYDGYEGSITGWLIPYVEPTYKIQLHDSSHTDKNIDVKKSQDCYYVTGTEISFSSAGGVRTIKLGRKI